MTLIDAIQLISIRAVEKPDGSYFLRRVCRWYSREFNTALHLVEELPVDYVLQHYFESIYEDMDAEERKERIESLLEPAHKKKERVYQQEMEEMELEEFARFTAQQQKLDESKKEESDGLSNISVPAPGMPIPVSPMREPELVMNKNTPPPMPDIRMEFADPNLLDEDFDSIPEPPPKK